MNPVRQRLALDNAVWLEDTTTQTFLSWRHRSRPLPMLKFILNAPSLTSAPSSPPYLTTPTKSQTLLCVLGSFFFLAFSLPLTPPSSPRQFVSPASSRRTTTPAKGFYSRMSIFRQLEAMSIWTKGTPPGAACHPWEPGPCKLLSMTRQYNYPN